MTNVEIITIGIYIVVYAIVFIIQKSQFDKQKSIMEKYEKMFSIINIDEIEKYVNIKEKALKLQFENREEEIKKTESIVNKNLEISNTYINKSESLIKRFENLDKLKNEAELVILKRDNYLNNRMVIDEKLIELYEEENNEIYNFINNDLKTKDELKGLFYETNILAIRNEFIQKRKELLENMEELPKLDLDINY